MDVTVRYLYNGVISSDPPPNLRGRRAVRLGLPGLPFCRTVQLSSRYHIHSYSVTPLIYSLGMASCFASDLLKCQAIHLNVSAQSLDQPTQRENLKHRRLARCSPCSYWPRRFTRLAASQHSPSQTLPLTKSTAIALQHLPTSLLDLPRILAEMLSSLAAKQPIRHAGPHVCKKARAKLTLVNPTVNKLTRHPMRIHRSSHLVPPSPPFASKMPTNSHRH